MARMLWVRPYQPTAYPPTQSNSRTMLSQGSYQFADAVQNQVHNLLADGVMASGIIIGCIFLPCDQLLWVEELPVGPRAHFIYKETM